MLRLTFQTCLCPSTRGPQLFCIGSTWLADVALGGRRMLYKRDKRPGLADSNGTISVLSGTLIPDLTAFMLAPVLIHTCWKPRSVSRLGVWRLTVTSVMMLIGLTEQLTRSSLHYKDVISVWPARRERMACVRQEPRIKVFCTARSPIAIHRAPFITSIGYISAWHDNNIDHHNNRESSWRYQLTIQTAPVDVLTESLLAATNWPYRRPR